MEKGRIKQAPLPRHLTPVDVWGSNIPSLLLSQPAAYALNDGEVVALVLMPAYIQRAGAVAQERANYIAHACNAYPKLVEALCMWRDEIEACNLRDGWTPEMDKSDILLRELGEE